MKKSNYNFITFFYKILKIKKLIVNVLQTNKSQKNLTYVANLTKTLLKKLQKKSR